MNRYKFYVSALITRGYCRSTILDTSTGHIHFIPNEMAAKLARLNKKGFTLDEFEKDEQAFLIEKELVFKIDNYNADCFPAIGLNWDFPAKITNAVVELSCSNMEQINVLSDFEGIAHFNLIVRADCRPKYIDVAFSFLSDYECDSCEITLLDGIKNNVITHLEEQLTGLKKSVVLNNWSGYTLTVEDEEKNEIKGSRMIDFNEEKIPLTLTKSLIHFAEAQQHHTYFNRKLYIGINGEIKNAPESTEHFGFIGDLNNAAELDEIIQSDTFKQYWYVKKDETDVCKDCEFRYLCIDNKIPTKRSNNSWFYKQEACVYNPYIAKWKGQQGYKTLKETGVLSNEQTFKINTTKIAQINETLWTD